MNTFQSPRGTRDILPAEQPAWQKVREAASEVAQQMGYQPITIPSYEEVGLFQRAIGAGTDVIDKELFLVAGKQSESETPQYALRPEGTAGIVRAFIEHGMHTWPQPVKLFSFVNNFRYDRPQKGRYREHVQFDIEYFGDKGPFADAWIIYTTWCFLRRTGLQGLKLKLNSLATQEERGRYIQALVAYFTPLRAQLSEDSQKRIETNPLRILDSKDPRDQALAQIAPKLDAFYGPETRSHLDTVCGYLEKWHIPFLLDPFLVRGLDYYSHTAFEWTLTGSEGQQDSLGGGGRYDGLLVELGGPDVGGVGAGLGLDRIVEALQNQGTLQISEPKPQIYLIAADPDGLAAAPAIIDELIGAHISLDCNLSKDSLGAQMKSAGRSGAHYALILGKEELEKGEVTLKDLRSGEQSRIERTAIVSQLTNE